MEWKDLKPLFEDLLNLPASTLPSFQDFMNYPSHLTEVSDANPLDALSIRWTYPVVCIALSTAQDHLESRYVTGANRYPQKISMAKGWQAWFSDLELLKPDWAGVVLSYHDRNKPVRPNKRHYQNILPGDTKLSTKFKSEWGWGNPRFNDPLIQIFTYCRRASVPYGYLIAQGELVIVRLFYNRLTNEPNNRLYLDTSRCLG